MEEELKKASPQKIQEIIKNNKIVIPASLLYTFLQYTELSVQRGGIRAEELTMIGTNYELGTRILNELLSEKLKGEAQEIQTIKESEFVAPEKTKKKKKIKKSINV